MPGTERPLCVRMNVCNALPYVFRLNPGLEDALPERTRVTCPFLFTSTTNSVCNTDVGSFGMRMLGGKVGGAAAA